MNRNPTVFVTTKRFLEGLNLSVESKTSSTRTRFVVLVQVPMHFDCDHSHKVTELHSRSCAEEDIAQSEAYYNTTIYSPGLL
jgi:hypothetical protein